MNKKIINEVGNRYGNLTVLEYSHINAERKAVWICKCDCGNVSSFVGRDLRNGSRCMCKNCSREKLSNLYTKDLIGRKFGKLTVISKIKSRGSAMWRCKCECDNEINVTSNSLLSEKKTSCGCDKYFRDLSGQKFGYLTALYWTGKRKDSDRVWRCRCECGKEKDVCTQNLVRSSTLSCGCKIKKDLKGKKIGRLTVLYPLEERRKRKVYWHCRCECGVEKDICAGDLLSKKIVSCGCYNLEKSKKKRFVDITGNKYGFLTVISLNDKTDKYERRYWNCECVCGNTAVIKENSLKSGGTSSCGCIRSKAEMECKLILSKHNIEFIPQKTFKNCVYKGKLKFDIFIPSMNLCIELDGGQHDFPVKRFGGEVAFNVTKIRDNIKTQYCKDNNITLFRISYIHFDILEQVLFENGII